MDFPSSHYKRLFHHRTGTHCRRFRGRPPFHRLTFKLCVGTPKWFSPQDLLFSPQDLKALAKEVKGMYLRNFDASQRRQLCPDGNASAFLEQPWYSNDPIPWQFYILSNLHYVLAGRKPGAPEPPEYLVKMAMYVFVAAIATVRVFVLSLVLVVVPLPHAVRHNNYILGDGTQTVQK